jgi:rubrerythrin
MDIGSLLLILALLTVVGWFIARPLFERQATIIDTMPDQQDHAVSTLLAERDRILNALQELDFDHALGKIPEEDYPAQRAVLVQQGAQILRQLDEFNQQPVTDDQEARLEAAIAARRADAGRPVSSGTDGRAAALASEATLAADTDEEIEIILAARRRERQDKSVGFCPNCGRSIQKSDRFCPKCGQKIS